MIKILISPEYIDISPTDIVIFLAGPIQGSYEWHEEFIKKISERLKTDKNVIICSPKRIKKDDNFNYDEQVNWESYYLHKSSKQGIIVFWLAKEIEKIEGRSYAQTTRFELAEWWTKGQYINNFKIVVGADKEFNGLKYINKKFKDNYPLFNMNYSIDKTIDEIIKKVV